MNKIYLVLEWVNHVQVTRAQGKKTVRNEHYTELVCSTDLLSRILKRVRTVYGAEHKYVDVAFNNFHSDVKSSVSNNNTVSRTICASDTRKMFTYKIRPLKIQFNVCGATYVQKDDKGIVHVGGERPYVSASGKRHSGLSQAERDKHELERLTGGAPASLIPKEGSKPIKKASNRVDKKTEPSVESKVEVKQTPSGKKWSKKVLTECEKWNVDVNALPANKPKGMNNRIWKQVSKAA